MAVQSEQSSEMLTLCLPRGWGSQDYTASGVLRHSGTAIFGPRQRPREAVKEVRRVVELFSGHRANAAVQPVSLHVHSTIGGMITWFATGSLLQDLIWKFMV